MALAGASTPYGYEVSLSQQNESAFVVGINEREDADEVGEKVPKVAEGIKDGRVLSDNISERFRAYEVMREEIEREHFGKWVLFYYNKAQGVYESGEVAWEDAWNRGFPLGQCLTRRAGFDRQQFH